MLNHVRFGTIYACVTLYAYVLIKRRYIMAFLMQVLWMPPGSVDSAIFLIDWLGNNPVRSWKEQQNLLSQLAKI